MKNRKSGCVYPRILAEQIVTVHIKHHYLRLLRHFKQYIAICIFCIGMLGVSANQANAHNLNSLKPILKYNSSSNHVKEDACSNLSDMGYSAPAVPALTAELHSKDESLLDYAISAQGQIGPQTSSAIKPLKWESINCPYNDIRQLALSSISPIVQSTTYYSFVNRDSFENGFVSSSFHKFVLVDDPVSAAIPTGKTPPIFALYPQLLREEKPSWVKPGLRLTYYTASATVAGEGKQWRLDPNGQWVTPDGRRWSGEKKHGSSGQGYTQVDVVGMSNGRSFLNMTQYLIPGLTGVPIAESHVALLPFKGSATEFWINPSILRRLKDKNSDSIKVLRAPYTVNGTKHNAVWIQDGTSSTEELHIYDEKSGLLLHFTSSGKGRKSPITAGNEMANTPSVTLDEGTLVQKRVVNIPWKSATSASWFSRIRGLSYTGTLSVRIPGSYTVPIKTAFSAQTAGHGANWIYFKTSSITQTIGALPQSGTQMCGLYQFGGFWAPPTALAKLTAGEILDRDPITGVVTSVIGSNDGGKIVWLKMQNQAQVIELGYNVSNGLMVTEQHVVNTPRATMKTVLQLQNQE